MRYPVRDEYCGRHDHLWEKCSECQHRFQSSCINSGHVVLYLYFIDNGQYLNKVIVKSKITNWLPELYEDANTIISSKLFKEKELLEHLKSKYQSK